MFLKEKLYISMKVRAVADRRKQREKIEPKDATYPTVLTEAVMTASIIGALEGRDVAVVDIPGAYLSENMDDRVHRVLRVTRAELVVAADPALYLPFIRYETVQEVLYVRLQKTLYSCLKISFLFY